MENLKKYHDYGTQLIDKLKLTTYPIAVRLVPPEEEVSKLALHPHQMFGSEVPACLAYTWCRRGGFHFYLEGSDIACKPVSIHYFGLESLESEEELYEAWTKKAAYKRDAEAEKKSREKDATLAKGEIQGLVVSPLHETIAIPHLVMVFCSPLTLSHLILAATYDGSVITSYFNGMESSCKEGIVRTYKSNQCQVVCPGMGDRVMAGVQDHEMIFSIPESQLEPVINNLFKAGTKISPNPFGIPHLMATLGPVSSFNKPNEPGVWSLLRRKIKKVK